MPWDSPGRQKEEREEEAGSQTWRKVDFKLPDVFLDVGSPELSKQAGIKM